MSFFAFTTLTCMLALTVSLADFPDLPSAPDYPARWVERLVRVFKPCFGYFAVMAAWGVVWLHSRSIVEHDVRLALITAAMLFLIMFAVENRVPATLISALRSIRQALAHGRVSLAEAQSQVDLLFVGRSLTQSLQPKYNELLATIERARATQAKAHESTVNYGKMVKELLAAFPNSPFPEEKWLALETLANNREADLREAVVAKERLTKEHESFVNRLKLLTSLSFAAAEEANVFSNEISAKLTELWTQLNQTTKECEELKKLVNERRAALASQPTIS